MKHSVATWSDSRVYEALLTALSAGGVVLTPTDTVPGLLASVTAQGVQALDRIKQRENKPYLVLVGDKDRLHDLVAEPLSEQVHTLIRQCWPGPLTIIFKASPHLPVWASSLNKTLAVRMPRHQGLLKLLEKAPALFSTSANISDEPVPQRVADVSQALINKMAYIVGDEIEDGQQACDRPSTIIDCSGPKIRVVREGAYPISELATLVNLD